MSSPSTRRRIGQGGSELQQWLKGPALPQKRFAKTVQGEWGIGNGNDAEPCPPDVQCSVGLRGISYLLCFGWCRRRARFPGGAITYRPRILDLIIMQNRKRCRVGRQQQESQSILSSV